MSHLGKETGFKTYSPAEGIRLPAMSVHHPRISRQSDTLDSDSILNDIMAIEDSLPDDMDNLINYEKCRSIYESVRLFQSIQQRTYNLQPVIQITRTISKLPDPMPLDDLIELAYKMEARRQTLAPQSLT